MAARLWDTIQKHIIPRPPCDISSIAEEAPLTPSLEGKDQSQDLSGCGKDLLCPFTGVGLVPGLMGLIQLPSD